ncbi:MAG: hypothetical protein WCO25_05690 [Candidatus Uhrbacteria bacterium]
MKEFLHVNLRVFFIPVTAFVAAMVVPALLVYVVPSLIPVFVILALIGVVAGVNEQRDRAPRKDSAPRKVITFVRKAPAEKS